MTLPYDRAQRIADEIHHIIAMAVTTELSDPRLNGLEITRVKLTKDLKVARIYYHLRDIKKEQIESAKKGLQSAKGYLKKLVKNELDLRYMPEFEFFYDETIDLQERIDRLMSGKDLKK